MYYAYCALQLICPENLGSTVDCGLTTSSWQSNYHNEYVTMTDILVQPACYHFAFLAVLVDDEVQFGEGERPTLVL